MLVIRGNKLTLFPLRDETLESFWRDTEDVLNQYSLGLDEINELELSSLYLSCGMTDKLGQLLQQHTFTKISLQSCTATSQLLDYFMKKVQCRCQLECLESNGTLSDCWSPSSMQILEEIPVKTLRLLGMSFPQVHDVAMPDAEKEEEDNATTGSNVQKNKPLHEDLLELDLTGCQWAQLDSLLSFLESCTSLQKVSFKCCRLVDSGIAQILSTLASLTKLETIDLGVNQCGPEGIQAVASFLESPSTSLQFLDLSYQVVPGGVAFHFERLSQALMSNAKCKTPLKILRLAGNQIRDAQLASLAKALEHCCLERLDLSTNCISNQGLQSLRQGLARNQHLKSLNLRNNEFANLSMFLIMDNVSLHNVQHSCPPNCPGSQEVDYVCKLNQGGRILLRQQAVPQGLWPTVLARCCQQNNSDAMYYLLQQGQHR
ncbi:MAG: hypothetical protein SGBAC_004013 [Bacillariaceae sp.]